MPKLWEEDRGEIAIAVDQSYTRLGIAVASSTGILSVKSYDYVVKGRKIKTKRLKRLYLSQKVWQHVEYFSQFGNVFIVMEEPRPWPLNVATISALAAMIYRVADSIVGQVPLYTISTGHWKKQTLGTNKANKELSIKFAQMVTEISNDDEADAVCIAIAALLPDTKLKEVD